MEDLTVGAHELEALVGVDGTPGSGLSELNRHPLTGSADHHFDGEGDSHRLGLAAAQGHTVNVQRFAMIRSFMR